MSKKTEIKEEEAAEIEESGEANSLEFNTAGGCLDTLWRLVNFLNYDNDGKNIMQNLADEIINSAKKEKPTKTVNNSPTNADEKEMN